MKEFNIAYRKDGIHKTVVVASEDGTIASDIKTLEDAGSEIILITQVSPTIKPVIKEDQT